MASFATSTTALAALGVPEVLVEGMHLGPEFFLPGIIIVCLFPAIPTASVRGSHILKAQAG